MRATKFSLLIGFLILFNVKLVYPQMIINSELLTMPVLIELPNSKSYGSGFFFTDSSSFFLVTAKHNLFDMQKNSLIDKEAILINYPRDPEKDQPNVIKINLVQLVNENKYLISKFQDICAIEIATSKLTQDSTILIIDYFAFVEKITPSTRISSYTRNHLTQFDSIKVSTDLFIFGYPTSLSSEKQFDHLRPLLRKGVVSGKNRLNKTIIIDCPVYPGNSGGPVVIQEQESLGYFTYSIIGIVIEYVPFKDYWQSMSNKRIVHEEAYNSGLSIVVPIDELLDILSQYRKRGK